MIEFFPHVYQNLVLSLFFILAPLRFVQWYFTVALICISLMADIAGHLSGADLQSAYPLFGETRVWIHSPFSSLVAQLVKNPSAMQET